jgi:hypothetical protein
VAEIGLYTKDNRWMRGEGRYRYDCDIAAVAGRDWGRRVAATKRA